MAGPPGPGPLSPPVPSRASPLAHAGLLRVYLGAAPGVGKTFAMLHEGQRRKARGTDVVVGWVETYGRARTIEAIDDLEVIPRRQIEHRGVTIEEMDVAAILARRPQVALVDELAHTNAPGSTHPKRYQDVLDLCAAGINVISTVNVQHIESLNDTVFEITGVRVRETVPDWVIDQADELEIIDQTPEALQKRMLHGNVFADGGADAALHSFFRTSNLAALRELALRRVVEHTERKRLDYLKEQNIDEAPQGSETVLVCLPPTLQAQQLVRRGVRLSERLPGQLIVLHISQPGKRIEVPSSIAREVQRAMQLARELGAKVVTVEADDVAQTIIEFANRENVTQMILGGPNRSWWQELLSRSILRKVLRKITDIDVHVVQRVEPR